VSAPVAVDLFAGAGGMTAAARLAGLRVAWAANHWPFAVEAHSLNHPETSHVCQDLRQADWSRLPRHDIMLAAPCCQGNSNASQPKRRADRRFHDTSRATAWAVVDAVETCLPKVVVVENVPEFRTAWNKYGLWRQALESDGYTLSEHVLTATHYGVPQRRTRLFVIGILGRLGAAPAPERPRPRREPAFGPCIEWDTGDWRPLSAASRGAQLRMTVAKRRHGRRVLSQHTTNHRGVSLDEPIRTITTQDHWVVVDGGRYRPLTIREQCAGMGFPLDYRWPANANRRDAVVALGNAVVPAMGKAVIEAALDAA
jgi:DNA (cytosine-5)-methyltransferase 1